MANYQQLKAAIDQVIKANGQKEITGPVLNDTLKAIVNSLGAGYQFRGVATPSTNPGTPDQNVFYIAGQGGTYTNFNSIVLPDGVSVLKWNGSWSSETILAGDGVFDISAYKATGGTLATFADLSTALDGGNNIPSALRKGGMSVKFVLSSDNKYVQARCMAQNFTTDVTQWQGVDAVPTAGSNNLVKSGGVVKKNINNNNIEISLNFYIDLNGERESEPSYSCSELIRVSQGDKFIYTGSVGSSGCCVYGYTYSDEKVGIILPYGDYYNEVFTIPNGVDGIRICGRNENYGNNYKVTASYLKDYNYCDRYNTIRGILQITGKGRIDKGTTGVGKVGDVYINQYSNSLYICTQYTSPTNFSHREYGYMKVDDLFIYKNKLVRWNGSELIGESIGVWKIDKIGYNSSECFIESAGEIFYTQQNKTVYVVDTFTSSNDFTFHAVSPVLKDTDILLYNNIVLTIGGFQNSTKGFVTGVNITGQGTMGSGNSGVGKVGDIYYNVNAHQLFMCCAYRSSTNFGQVGLGNPVVGGIYCLSGKTIVIWNGSEFVSINDLFNKKLIVIGDSIPEGASMDVPQGATICSDPYPSLVAKKHGMLLKNYSIGGSTIAVSSLVIDGVEREYGGTVTTWDTTGKDTSKYYVLLLGNYTTEGVGNYRGQTYYYNGSSWVTSSLASRTPLCGRFQLMDNDADIVVVAAGTNDFQYNWTAIGTIDDTEPNTFYGALNYLCTGLCNKYVGKTILFITPIKRCQTQTVVSDIERHNGGNYGTIDSQNYYNKTLKEYGDIIKEVCSRFSIPVIDFYSESGLAPQLSSQILLFDTYKTHPTQEGHEVLKKIFSGKIKTYI